MKEIEVVVCKSSHGTHERTKLQEELNDADLFVPEFFGSSVLEESHNVPAEKVREAYERAKKGNSGLEVLEVSGAEALFSSQFGEMDQAESDIRKTLAEMAFVLPLTSSTSDEAYERYKSEIPGLFKEIERYAEISGRLEKEFCNLLAKSLREKIEKAEKKGKLKIVVDSGHTHQYPLLKDRLEQILHARVNVREAVEKETLTGFVEDLVVRTKKGELTERNLKGYSDEIAQGVLFEAVYSPYMEQISSPAGIDREKQEEVYSRYLPKVEKWGEQELMRFWEAIMRSPELKPYTQEEDMEEVLKNAGLLKN
jgi:hypothetical protein